MKKWEVFHIDDDIYYWVVGKLRDGCKRSPQMFFEDIEDEHFAIDNDLYYANGEKVAQRLADLLNKEV